MKALSVLFALCVCLSNGEQWTWSPEIYTNIAFKHPRLHIHGSWDHRINPYFLEKPTDGEFAPPFFPSRLRPYSYNKLGVQVAASRPPHQTNSYSDNKHLEASRKRLEDLIYFLSNPTDKNYVGNEVLRNNGVQNGLTLNNRRLLDSDAGVENNKHVVSASTPSQGNSYSDNKHLEANAKRTEDVVNLYSNPTDKNYAGNEVLRNNGVQNGLTLNSRRSFGLNVNLKHNNYPLSGGTSTSMLTGNLQTQPNALGNDPGSSYWLKASNQNNKDSYWESLRPSWYDPIRPIPHNTLNKLYPSPQIIYPDNNNWNLPNQNQNECDNLSDVLNELRLLLHTNNISQEKNGLKALISIVKVFAVNNNLQYASFDTIVGEIAKVLLNANPDNNNLRDDDLTRTVQEFKSRELTNFLLEIRLHRETSLQVVVSKLALLLSRFKQDLTYKNYSQESIRLVINKLVQWAVPVVGYYFEKECKIKTQQYILQNLLVALNVNSENVNVLNTGSQLGGLDNSGTQGNLWGQDDLGSLGFLGNLENIGNLGVLGNSQNPRNLGSLESLVGTGHQGNAGGLSAVVLGGVGNLGVPGNQGYSVNLDNSDNLENPGDLSGLNNLIPLSQEIQNSQ